MKIELEKIAKKESLKIAEEKKLSRQYVANINEGTGFHTKARGGTMRLSGGYNLEDKPYEE